MSHDIITDILNRVEALVDIGAVTYRQVAKEAGLNARTLERWFGEKRRYRPNGAAAFALQDYVSKKTLALSAAGNRKQTDYRRAYNRVCERFPVNGKSV